MNFRFSKIIWTRELKKTLFSQNLMCFEWMCDCQIESLQSVLSNKIYIHIFWCNKIRIEYYKNIMLFSLKCPFFWQWKKKNNEINWFQSLRVSIGYFIKQKKNCPISFMLHRSPIKGTTLILQSSVSIYKFVWEHSIFRAMNTIEALHPLTRVFQLFGLSITRCPTIKYIPFHRVIKYYSLLLIAIRSSAFCYLVMKSNFGSNCKLDLFVDRIVLNVGHFLGMSISTEAFFKARHEDTLMEKISEIDNILIQNFDVDLKLGELRKSAVKRLRIWICIQGSFCGLLLYAHHHTHYSLHAMGGALTAFTSTFTYLQIITWADLIRYRLHILKRLIDELKYGRRERQSYTLIDASGSNDDIENTHVFEQLRLICNLYNRLWLQTNRLNERFKFSMVPNIANNFTHLVGLLYYIITCLGKKGTCEYLACDIVACMMNTFRLTMINMAGQHVADEALQVAYAVHRNKRIRISIKLNSFVCVHFLNCLRFFQK